MNIRRLKWNRFSLSMFVLVLNWISVHLNVTAFLLAYQKMLHYLNYRLICVVADGYSHRAKSNIKENIHFEIGAGLTERARRASYGLYSFSLQVEIEFGTRWLGMRSTKIRLTGPISTYKVKVVNQISTDKKS